MVHLLRSDLNYVLPDENGLAVCDMAIKELSHFAVQTYDAVMSDEAQK
jgi:hypothetical protein